MTDPWGIDPKDEATVDRLMRSRRKVYADTAIPAPSSSEDWTPPPPQACLSPPLLVGALVVGLGLGSLLALAAAALAWSLQ